MMIKVFTTDKDGKIKLTTDELKKLLDEAYWEGYRNNNNTWTYQTPSWSPYITCANGTSTTLTMSAEAVADGGTIPNVHNVSLSNCTAAEEG